MIATPYRIPIRKKYGTDTSRKD